MGTFLDDWRQWQHERFTALTAPHGTASLSSTNWLGDEPTDIAELGERWCRLEGRAARADGSLTLAKGESIVCGDLLLRVIERNGEVALRVFDPASPTRTALVGIDAFPVDPAWRFHGRFRPATGGAEIGVGHSDGGESTEAVAGIIDVEVGGTPLHLTVFPGVDGAVWFVFGDGTNGVTTKQFRFLQVQAPAADGTVAVDFNRAYLPPCAFSHHYLCPLPPAENRLRLEVTAGERFPITSCG